MAFLQIYYGYGGKYHVRSDYEVLVHHRLLQRCWCIAVLTTDHSMSSALHVFSLAATDVDQQHRREAESNDMSHDVSMHTDVCLAFIRASIFGV